MAKRLMIISALFLGFAANSFAAGKVSVCVPAFKEELMTATVLVAKDKGFFKEEGIDANVKLWPSSGTESQRKQVVAHSNVKDRNLMPSYVWTDTGVGYKTAQKTDCDFGAVLIDSMILSGLDAAKLKPLYFYAYGASYDTHLLIPQNSKIESVAELKGKTIRVGQVPTQIALRNILAEAGLKPSDVKLVYNDFYKVSEQFAKNEIAAAITYNPTTALLLSSGEAKVLKKNVMSNYVQSFVPHAAFAAKKSYAEKNSEQVAKMERAIAKASEYLANNPQEFVKVYKKNVASLGLTGYWKDSDAQVEKSAALIQGIKLYRGSDVINTAGKSFTVLEGIDQYQNLLDKMGLIKAPLDLASWKKSTAKNTASY